MRALTLALMVVGFLGAIGKVYPQGPVAPVVTVSRRRVSLKEVYMIKRTLGTSEFDVLGRIETGWVQKSLLYKRLWRVYGSYGVMEYPGTGLPVFYGAVEIVYAKYEDVKRKISESDAVQLLLYLYKNNESSNKRRAIVWINDVIGLVIGVVDLSTYGYEGMVSIAVLAPTPLNYSFE